MSRLVNGHPLPPHVFEFIVGFGILFAALVILKEVKRGKEWVKWIPQGIAFAIGMYNPPSFTIARVIGGIACYYWNDFCDWTTNPKSFVRKQIEPYRLVGKVFIVVVASGFVLGEGTFAIVNMTMRVFNVPHF
jgi:uncharacterized oligopeptide transporter (OPT) family protein